MARTRKSIQPLNLYKYDVLIDDKGTRSDYFKISQFDGYFYGGRNAFLVAGAGNLRPNSNILVEILNKDGSTVYSAPITSFVEGNSRLIQVEVYSDTPIGPGKIVILGCATTYADGSPIPTNWKDTYNVRWITDVIISPRIQNKTPIRFLEEPTVVVDEKFYKAPSSSLFTKQVAIPVDIEIVPKYYNVFPNGYQIKIVGPSNTQYDSDYYNGIVTGSITILSGNESDTASIKLPITKIYNKELAETEGSLIYTNNNKLILNGFISSSGSYLSNISPFGNVQVTGSVKLEYNILETFSTGSDVSYARLRVVGAKTLSGEVNKLRVSYKTTTEPGEFVVLSDVDVGVQELLAIDSGSKIVQTGKFKNIVINDYWYSATMSLQKNESTPTLPSYYNSSSLINTQFDVSQCCVDLLDSVNLTPAISNSKFVNDVSYFIGTRKENFVRLFRGTEYTLAFDAFVSKASSSLMLNQRDYSLEVYLVEQENTKNKILDTNKLGQLVGVLTPQSNFLRQNFERVEFNFAPKIISDGNFGLRFVIYGGNWSLANVSVKPAQEPFFSPDEVDILIPNVNYANKILTFKVQYLDINNNSAEKASFSIPTYFTGSTLPSNYVILSGSSGAGFPFVGDAQITGSLSVLGQISGSIQSSSYSITSSYAQNTTLSETASYALNIPSVIVSSSSQINTGSFTGSFVGDGSGLTNLPYVSNLQIDNYTFVGDGVTTGYTLSKVYHDTSVFVSVDGLVQTNTIDYNIFANNVNFISAPPSESNIFIRGFVNTTTGSVGTFSGSFIGNIENAVFAISASHAITSSYVNIEALRPGDALQNIFYVTQEGSDSNDGKTLGTSFRTIKKACDAANHYIVSASIPPLPRVTIQVKTGYYEEVAPITVPKNTSIIGDNLRTVVISPTTGTKNENLFLMNNATYAWGLRLEGCEIDDLTDPRNGFFFAFAPGAYIVTSPYVQNCTANHAPAAKFYVPLDYEVQNPEVGNGPGGMIVDDSVLDGYSPLRSMIVDAYTQVAFNGIGICVRGAGYAQLVSFFTNFSHVGVWCIDGGHASLLNSNTTFGDYGIRASGKRILVVPDISTANTASDSSAASLILAEKTSIQNYMINKLQLSGSYSSSYLNTTSSVYTSTLKDSGLLIDAISSDLLGKKPGRISQFTQRLFKGQDVSSGSIYTLPTASGFDTAPVAVFRVNDGLLLANDFIKSWEYIKEYIIDDPDAKFGSISVDAKQKIEDVINIPINTITSVVINNEPTLLQEFGSLATSTSHDFSYAGAGVNFLALPSNQGGIGQSNLNIRVYEEGGGRVYHTSGDETGDFYTGQDFVIRQATGIIEGRTFNKAIAARFTPLNLALEG